MRMKRVDWPTASKSKLHPAQQTSRSFMSSSPPAKNYLPAPPVVALTGFMAAGKSTIGRALASRLHWRFIDLDAEIETRSHLSVRQIFNLHGEIRFRQVESEALELVLTTVKSPTVIALGGGAYVQPQNFALLRDHGAHVVFLELDIETLLRRCRILNVNGRPEQNPRPLASDEATFRALYAQRLPLYRRAELTVIARDKNEDQVADEIALGLGLPRPPNGR
jgi:shikimate kinase